MSTYAEISFYWFLTPSHDPAYLEERTRLWFRKDERTDQIIQERFGPDVEAALKGERDGWADVSKGALGLILLLDQLTRNIYRGTASAFAGDDRAQALCLEGLTKGQDQRLHPIERVFFYLPLEHSEDRGLQARSVELFTALAEDVPAAVRSTYDSYLDYARRHQEIVDRFGRFPHRNAALGRASTTEEVAFLELPGSSF